MECEDYADKITAERVRRVINGVPTAKDESLQNGLGGSFTYCTLGEEISPEKMLTGEHLPDYDTLARHLVYTATGQAPATIRKARSKDGLFHETDDRLFYLIYQPDLAFLRSAESALNGDRAERIARQAKTKQKTAVVFATHKFMGQKELTERGDHAPCIASGLKLGSVSEREEPDDEAEPVYGRTDHRDAARASGREVCGRSVPQARDLGGDI